MIEKKTVSLRHPLKDDVDARQESYRAVGAACDGMAHGRGQPRQHERWLQLTSDELATMGQKDMRPGQPKDTVLTTTI